MRVEIWCRYLLKVESCVMLNVFCHLTVEFINTRIFRTLRLRVSQRFVAVF